MSSNSIGEDKERISVTVDAALKSSLIELAQKSGVSLNLYCNLILESAQKSGFKVKKSFDLVPKENPAAMEIARSHIKDLERRVDHKKSDAS